MNVVDALVFLLLGCADLALLLYWRRVRSRWVRMEKMERSLRLALLRAS